MKTNPKRLQRASVMAALLIPCAAMRAQVSPDHSGSPAVSDDVIVLSPFEVKSSSTADGYVATSTLAGNRLATELRDVGSSITVVTSQFLKDTGATSNTSLLVRLGGTEVGGTSGNFASPGAGSTFSLLTEDTIKPSENTRIRGLAAADNTHDFFVSDIPWDSYNTDSIAIQRGPNSILFGQGSPAGIINATSKGANFKNSGEVEGRYGSYGSTRVSLDINQVIVDKQIAVRLDLLNDHEKFEQEPAYSKDQRISGAIRIDPEFLRKNGNRTIFKANFESGKIDSNNPRALPPTDHITPWFDPAALVYVNSSGVQVTKGTPGAIAIPGSGAYQAGLNGLRSWDNNTAAPNPPWSAASNGYLDAGRAGTVNFDSYFTNGQTINSTFPLVAFQNGTTAGSAGQYRFTAVPQGATPGGFNMPYGAFPGSWLTINGAGAEAVFAGKPYSIGGIFTDTSITDPSIYNFYKNLIDGSLKSEWQRFWSGSANLTQTFLNDQVGVSFDYNKQHYEDGQINPLGGAVPLYVDVMKTNNDGASLAAASANPGYGTPFVYNGNFDSNFSSTRNREDTRATAFVTHNFKKDGNEWWQSLLGTQTLTGLADNAKLTTETMNWQHYGYLGDNTALANSLLGNGGQFGSANFRNVLPQQIIYLGGSLVGKSLTGANIPRVTGNPTIGNQPIGYFSFAPSASAPGGVVGWTGAANTTLSVTNSEDNPDVNRRLLATRDAITRSITTSEALVYEGKWLDGAIVGIYGWRKDINKSWAQTATLNDSNPDDAKNIDFKDIAFSPAPQGRVEVQSRSYSIVGHLNELPGVKNFADKLPVDISLSYNRSSNFQPDSSRVNVNGDPVAPPSGETIDRGIRIATRNGKYALKINRYVTTITNGTNSDSQAFASVMANWVGFTADYGNRFFYHTDAGNTFQNGPGVTFQPTVPVGTAQNTNGINGAAYYSVNGVYTQAAANLQASSTAATRAWETQINKDFPNFFKNWGMVSLAQLQAGQVSSGALQSLPGETNFAIAENSQSKGWEFELDANPLPNWRISVNATKTDAIVTKNGDAALDLFMKDTMDALKVAGGLGDQQWFWGQDINPSVPNARSGFYTQYNGTLPAFGTQYAALVQQQGVAVSQLAKWRFNLTTNYEFTRGVIKGLNVGGGLRYTSAEIVGYPPSATADPLNPPYALDLSRPEKAPSETYLDLWVGYSRKLTAKIDWHIQLNVENVGKNDYLIPVSYQAPIDGKVTPAFYRIGPTQKFTLTTRFSF